MYLCQATLTLHRVFRGTGGCDCEQGLTTRIVPQPGRHDETYIHSKIRVVGVEGVMLSSFHPNAQDRQLGICFFRRYILSLLVPRSLEFEDTDAAVCVVECRGI